MSKQKTLHDIAFEELGIEEGDFAKVVLKVDEDVHGNPLRWSHGMEEMLGKTFRVTNIDTSDNTIELNNGEWFSAISLEKATGEIKVQLPDYTAVVTKEGMEVGCQKLDKDKVLEIVQAAITTGMIDRDDVEDLDYHDD